MLAVEGSHGDDVVVGQVGVNPETFSDIADAEAC